MLDAEGRYILSGGSAFERLGIDATSVLGWRFHDLWDEQTVAVIASLFERASSGEETMFRNTFLRLLNELAISLVSWDGPEAYLFLADDISERVVEETLGLGDLQAIPFGGAVAIYGTNYR